MYALLMQGRISASQACWLSLPSRRDYTGRHIYRDFSPSGSDNAMNLEIAPAEWSGVDQRRTDRKRDIQFHHWSSERVTNFERLVSFLSQLGVAPTTLPIHTFNAITIGPRI